VLATPCISTTGTVVKFESTGLNVLAATPAVLSDTTVANDAQISIDVDGAGTGAKGLKVTVYYKRT
jgi:hypothetical protein